MENQIICPTCSSRYETAPTQCGKCGYPFAGTQQEKSVFIGQQILKKGKVSDTSKRVQRARIILWVIGGLNLLGAFLLNADPIDTVAGLIVAGVFIGFGFLTYKKPFISMLIPLIILLLNYALAAVDNPITLVQGLLWKFIFIGSLIYGMISVQEADRLKKESKYLNEQKY